MPEAPQDPALVGRNRAPGHALQGGGASARPRAIRSRSVGSQSGSWTGTAACSTSSSTGSGAAVSSAVGAVIAKRIVGCPGRSGARSGGGCAIRRTLPGRAAGGPPSPPAAPVRALRQRDRRPPRARPPVAASRARRAPEGGRTGRRTQSPPRSSQWPPPEPPRPAGRARRATGPRSPALRFRRAGSRNGSSRPAPMRAVKTGRPTIAASIIALVFSPTTAEAWNIESK